MHLGRRKLHFEKVGKNQDHLFYSRSISSNYYYIGSISNPKEISKLKQQYGKALRSSNKKPHWMQEEVNIQE